MLRHVAIIMDGNGRWANSRGLPKAMGHRRGAAILKEILECCIEQRIPYLTLYVFSLENWHRPKQEVASLMELLGYYLSAEVGRMHKQGICLKVLGNIDLLDADIKKDVLRAIELTKNNKNLTLSMALSYSARDEILMASKSIAQMVLDKKIQISEINEDFFAKQLYTKDIPDPDLMIRTSGEQRLSNFLLWQMAYTELFFTQTLWPDFTAAEFKKAINYFNTRKRRYGKTTDE
jgi:undecaprenyl diphosphate synthase